MFPKVNDKNIMITELNVNSTDEIRIEFLIPSVIGTDILEIDLSLIISLISRTISRPQIIKNITNDRKRIGMFI